MTKKPAQKRRLSGFGRRNPARYIKLDHGLLGTEAWRHLSPRACKLYIAVRARFNGMNNSTISYSMREAMKLLKCNPNSACAHFNELVDKGFLKCALDSSFECGKRRAREWTITAEPVGNNSPTRDFKQWRKGGCKFIS